MFSVRGLCSRTFVVWAVLALVWCGLCAAGSVRAQVLTEVCSGGNDEDLDGLADCRDPDCNSDATCVAAKMHGRRYLGVDLSEDYCAIAEERLSQTEAMDLDDIVV